MKKIIGIALASNVLFFCNAMGQTPKPEGEINFDEDRIVEVCEINAKNLGLEEEEVDAYIEQCIDDGYESYERDSERSEEDPEVAEEE